jgi:Ca2+-transporting ATPase
MAAEDTFINSGLTTLSAQEKLRTDGANELASAQPRNIGSMIWKVVSEPMLLLLFACGGIYLVLGDTHGAVVLVFFILIIVSISLFQEHKTERALEALRDLSSPSHRNTRRHTAKHPQPGSCLRRSAGVI